MTKRELVDSMKGMSDDCQVIICLDDGTVISESYAQSVEWDEGEISIMATF